MSPLLDTLSSALLTFEGDERCVTYLNQRARVWLRAQLAGQAEGWTFSQLFPEVKLERLLSRLSRGLRAEFTLELVSEEGRALPVTFSVKRYGEGLLLEGRDDSPLREVQQMLTSYSDMIETNNRRLAKEQRRVERLLYNILPDKCVQQLRTQGHTTPERFSKVSVLFLDFVGFTELSQRVSTRVLFEELNDIFTAFDSIIARHRCERIKTIGDAYLAVCGMPTHQPDHASLIACASFEMREYIRTRNLRSKNLWRCRIGIHCGEVTGGVVGRLKYIYDIFGDGVNTASWMESSSEPMMINISSALRAQLGPAFQVTDRGLISVKGKGALQMFFLDSVEGSPCADRLVESPAILDPQDTEIGLTPVILRTIEEER